MTQALRKILQTILYTIGATKPLMVMLQKHMLTQMVMDNLMQALTEMQQTQQIKALILKVLRIPHGLTLTQLLHLPQQVHFPRMLQFQYQQMVVMPMFFGKEQ